MIVCIAEKPSVARDIANVLGATNRYDGYIEGNGYQVTWTFGHLCTLKEPNDYLPEWKPWSLSQLPMIPQRFGIKLISSPSIEKQFGIIQGLMLKADMIVNCGDAGQEGELIQRWVMQKAGARCPVKRLWISSLTEDSIREGFQHLHEASDYNSLYEAGLSRAIGDWLLGMNATRLYTMKYGQNRQVLSVGRVQTPTLALIVNRQQEIDSFVPRQYWELKTLYRNTTFNAVVRKSDEELAQEAADAAAKPNAKPLKADNPGIEQITDKARGEELVNNIKDKPFIVVKVTEKKGVENPPRLYDLTSLQVDCNRKFGYSADETLKLIQSLYEKKVTTYPRVDTTFLSDDIYPKCPGILRGLKGYEDLTRQLEGRALPKSKKVFDNSKVTDHHAIIPTGQLSAALTDRERNVFDLIARHFIAVFYPECKVATTTVLGKAGDVLFRTSGKEILDPGWRTVFASQAATAKTDSPDGDDEAENADSKLLPKFTKGESGPHQPMLVEKWTQPPKPYTEATLLRAMETAGKLVDDDELRDALKENGIGRPSTRAAIIETLFKRNYIRKERKSLFPTPTGKELIQIIHEELLKSAELTGIWEKKLRQIERKTYQASTFIDELKQMVRQLVQQVLADSSNRRITVISPAKPDGKKPGKAAYGKTPKADGKGKAAAAKASTAKKKAAKKSVPTGEDAAKAFLAAKASASSSQIKQFATGSNPADTTVAVNLEPSDDLIGQLCPVCHKGHIIKGKTAYGCSEWRSGCMFRLPFKSA